MNACHSSSIRPSTPSPLKAARSRACPPRRTLLVCTEPRSGSNLLGDLLALGGQMPGPKEWLNPPMARSEALRLGLPFDFALADLLVALTAEHTDAEGTFTLKLMGHQRREMLAALRRQPGSEGASARQLLAPFFPGAHFLRLRRRDTVAQALSHLRAIHSQNWVAAQEQLGRRGNPLYSHLQILRLLEETENSGQGWEQFFVEGEIEPFELVYEELAADPVAAVRAIHAWLGLPPPVDEEALRQRAARGRQTAPTSSRWAERFRAERASFPDASAVPVFPAAAFALTLAHDALPGSTVCAGEVRARVDHLGGEPWQGARSPRGTLEGWVWIEGRIGHRHGAISGYPYVFQEVPPLAPGEVAEVDLHLPAIEDPGTYEVELTVRQTREDLPFPVSPSTTLTLEVTHPPARQAAWEVFPSLRPIDLQRSYVPTCGIFYDDRFPWIYHDDHEWLEIDPAGSDAHRLRVFDPHLGWIRCERARFNRWEREDGGATLVFSHREGTTRHFRLETTDAPFTIPTNDGETAHRALAARSG
ncbi:MAG: Stf0 family sulfotransferase [Opitutales bacterium]